MKEALRNMRRRLKFQRAIKDVYETPSGRIFFEVFMEHCGVTHPKFTKEPMELNWNESRRHLAMSYLKLLSQNDMESIMRQTEESFKHEEEDNYE